MSILKHGLALAAVATLVACGTTSPPPPAEAAPSPAALDEEPPVPAPEPEPDPAFRAWLDEQYEAELQFSPIRMTFLGRKDRYDELGDFSVEGLQKQLEWKRASVSEMEQKFDYEALAESDQLSYDVWKYQLQQQEQAMPFAYNGYVFHQMDSAQSFLGTFLMTFHKVDDKSDMEAYISRIRAVPTALDDLLNIAQKASDMGVRTPRFALRGVIEQATALTSGRPFSRGKDSGLWKDIQSEIEKLREGEKITSAEARLLRKDAGRALVRDLKPAYDTLVKWARAELKKSPKVASGVASQPNGEAYYAFRLANQTTTNMSADEIHELGLVEVKRIRKEMEGIMAKVEFEGELSDFFEHVRKADWNYYPNTDEGRQAYIDDATKAIENIKSRLPDYFGLLPKAGLIVKRVEPFRERDGAAQHYFPGTPDGSRPGVYYAHLSDMGAMPKNQLEVIAYHEGIPGHHMQISIAQELEGVPDFRTKAFFTAYMEGWALYSEALAKEMPGTYEDPYSDFGRLTTEMWRAIRLVVDTGLHAKGWTEQQAIDLFVANSPEPLESITSEVHRYIVMPGQATSYKVGMIKIQELRAEAEAKLGSAFDLSGFHDEVLGGGALPLDLLERKIRRWIEDTRPGAAEVVSVRP